MNKTAFAPIAILFLSTLMFLSLTAFEVQSVKAASGTIYIRANGSIDPATAPISILDNVSYALTGNINESITIERDSIVLDGAGHSIEGSGNGTGVNLAGRTNVTLENAVITGFEYGVWLAWSTNNEIHANNITKNQYGLWLYESSSNNIDENSMTANNLAGVWLYQSTSNNIQGNSMNMAGSYLDIELSSSTDNKIHGNNMNWIELYSSSGNSMYENEIGKADCWGSQNNYFYENQVATSIQFSDCSYNGVYGNSMNSSYINLVGGTGNTVSLGNNFTNGGGITLQSDSSNNMIYHNNFMNGTVANVTGDALFNAWDNGYPSGGNYWSNYAGTDFYNGPNQNQTGSDGICDTPYVLSQIDIDRYPLVTPWSGQEIVELPTIGLYLESPGYYYNPPQQAVKILARATDTLSYVKNVTLYYTTDNWTTHIYSLSMTYNSSNGIYDYQATIPGQPNGTTVDFEITAYNDIGGNQTQEGPELYFTQSTIPEFSPSLFLLVSMAATALAAVHRKKRKQTNKATPTS